MKEYEKTKGLFPDELEESVKQLEVEFDGVIIIQDRIVKYVNYRLAEFLGYTFMDTVGTPFARYVHPDELPKIVDLFIRPAGGKKAASKFKTVFMHRDGSKVYAEFLQWMITYQGKPANLVLILSLTSQKQQ